VQKRDNKIIFYFNKQLKQTVRQWIKIRPSESHDTIIQRKLEPNGNGSGPAASSLITTLLRHNIKTMVYFKVHAAEYNL
jgi:hypothetical protein